MYRSPRRTRSPSLYRSSLQSVEEARPSRQINVMRRSRSRSPSRSTIETRPTLYRSRSPSRLQRSQSLDGDNYDKLMSQIKKSAIPSKFIDSVIEYVEKANSIEEILQYLTILAKEASKFDSTVAERSSVLRASPSRLPSSSTPLLSSVPSFGSGSSNMLSGRISREEKKPETKEEAKKPETKEEAKKPETKPETKEEAKKPETKPETKEEAKKTEAKEEADLSISQKIQNIKQMIEDIKDKVKDKKIDTDTLNTTKGQIINDIENIITEQKKEKEKEKDRVKVVLVKLTADKSNAEVFVDTEKEKLEKANKTESKAKETESKAKETESKAKETESKAKETEEQAKQAVITAQPTETEKEGKATEARIAAEEATKEATKARIEAEETVKKAEETVKKAQANLLQLKARYNKEESTLNSITINIDSWIQELSKLKRSVEAINIQP